MAIIPRWEWRTFGQDLRAARRALEAQGEAGPLRESEETYVVSKASGDNTKIRGGLMDIKRLRHTEGHGLEQWEPIFKRPFPLTPEQLAEVREAWGIGEVPTPSEPMELAPFLEELVAGRDELRAVPVRKQRHAFTFAGCTAEFAQLQIDGQDLQTVCIEHEDPERVWRAVEELGLAAQENVNYRLSILRVIGWA